MNLLARIALLLVVGVPTLGSAQPEDAPAPSAEVTTPPPLLTAPPDSPLAAQEPAPPPFRGGLLPPQWKSPRPNYFVPRLLAGTFLGTLAGVGGLIGGFIIGLQLEQGCNPFDDVCSGDEMLVQAAPALLATGALPSLVVYGLGSALHGEGALSTTLLGGFAGTGLGALLSVALGSYAGLLAIPVLAAAGAVIAYEISDAGSRVQWTPVVGVTPGGGVLGGLIGRF